MQRCALPNAWHHAHARDGAIAQRSCSINLIGALCIVDQLCARRLNLSGVA